MDAPLQHTLQHKARKRFGQNFLVDANIIRKIVQSISVTPAQRLVEIGPGKGALTELLLQRHPQLDVIEVDRDLAAWLTERYSNVPGFRLHNQDVLNLDFSSLLDSSSTESPSQLVVVGNLPYNISTPLIFHLLQCHELIADMTFMLQLEVVQRLSAGPGDAHYGRLGIMVQYYCQVDPLFTVPPGAFQPAPKVQSAVVRLTPWKTPPHPARDPAMLATVVKTAFSQRRKTIRNTLKPLLDSAALERLDINPGLRAENLSLKDYVKISDSLT